MKFTGQFRYSATMNQMKSTLIKAINVLLRVYYELIMRLVHCTKPSFKLYIHDVVLLELKVHSSCLRTLRITKKRDVIVLYDYKILKHEVASMSLQNTRTAVLYIRYNAGGTNGSKFGTTTKGPKITMIRNNDK